MLTRTFFTRAPFAPGRFCALPAGAVIAKGTSADRLIAQRAGLLSRCASVFPETGESCAFYGGTLPGGVAAGNLLEAMLLTGSQLGDEELRRQALSLAMRVVAASAKTACSAAKRIPLRPAAVCCARCPSPIPSPAISNCSPSCCAT